MEGLNPLTFGDVPEGFEEQDDGSMLVPDEDIEEAPSMESSDFMANLVDVLPRTKLESMARDMIYLLEIDRESRKRRDEQYAEGIRRTGMGNDAPSGAAFEGASEVVHPVLAEGCVDFAAATMKELYPVDGPVKTKLYGPETDPVYQKARRKKDVLNWQMTEQIAEYPDELEQLLTQLPLGGSQYMKLWFSASKRRICCEFVPIDDILLPFSASSFYTASRATHVLHLDKYEFESRIDSKMYSKPTIMMAGMTPEQTAAATASDKIEGKEIDAYNEDGLRDVYEVYCWFDDLDDPYANGKLAPYVFSIDAYTEQPVGLYRNWEENDESLRKSDWIVEWKFIAWRGAYGIGLPHLIGGLAISLTGVLRALLDTAHLNNAASAVKLKGGRGAGTDKNVEIGSILELDNIPGVDDIRKLVMPFPFPPPSPVLFQLLGFLDNAAKGVVTTAEEKIADASNQMPVGTTLALIEQGSKVFSSIHARLHRAQRKTLEIICRLNRQYMEDQDYGPFNGQFDPNDFNSVGDVIPVSDPNIFSETQRFAQMQGVQSMTQDVRVPWNIHNVYRRLLQLMRVENPDEILPPPPVPVTANVLQENAAADQGQQVKANIQQDHLAHIQGHFSMIMFGLQNPLSNAMAMSAMLGHIGEHISLYTQVLAQTFMQPLAIQMQYSGHQVSPEAIMAMALQQAQQAVMQQLGGLFQQLPQIQQEIQKRLPPPQMPPEVQASIKIAEMDQQRRSQFDQAKIQADQARQQAESVAEQHRMQMEMQERQAAEQREDVRLQMEQRDQQFEQRMAQLSQQQDWLVSNLTQQVELLKNEADNKQHQMTELLKNADDNRTNLLIAQIKETLSAAVAEKQVGAENETERQANLAPQLEKLSGILEKIGQDKTSEALTAVIQGLQATMQELGRPKTKTIKGGGKTFTMTEG